MLCGRSSAASGSQRFRLSAGQHDGGKGGVWRLGGHLAHPKARGYQVRSLYSVNMRVLCCLSFVLRECLSDPLAKLWGQL